MTVVGRFHREAKAASKLDSPHVVEIYDFGQIESGELYIVMEFLRGSSLDKIIDREILSAEKIIEILKQIMKALSAAHTKYIIHRDLKPQNIFLKLVHGDEEIVKILDFGIAKSLITTSEISITRTGALLGTPYYMSPEQIISDPLDGRSDLYSIGIITYEMITKSLPFVAEEPIAVFMKHLHDPVPPIPENPCGRPVPRKLVEFTMKLLSKDRESRFLSANEALKFLSGIDFPKISQEDQPEKLIAKKAYGESIIDIDLLSSTIIKEIPGSIMEIPDNSIREIPCNVQTIIQEQEEQQKKRKFLNPVFIASGVVFIILSIITAAIVFQKEKSELKSLPAGEEAFYERTVKDTFEGFAQRKDDIYIQKEEAVAAKQEISQEIQAISEEKKNITKEEKIKKTVKKKTVKEETEEDSLKTFKF
jgi:serine/threonine protein kinase